MLRRVVFIVIVVMFLGGCTTKAPLSAKDFRQKANEICVQSREEINALPAPDYSISGSTSEYATKSVDIQQDALANLRELEPPKNLQADVLEWLSTVEQVLDLSEEVAQGIREGETTDNAQVVKLAAQANEQAAALRLDDCSDTS